MSERRKKKHRQGVVIEEPSKEELKMAKHVRFNTPKKNTTMQKQNKEYFVGSKAVDTLMESKWAETSSNGKPIFVSRDDAIQFMEKMLASRLFYRAMKVPKLDKEEKKALKKANEGETDTKARKRKKDKEETKDEKSEKDSKSDSKEEKKKKRRYKLEFHEEQIFCDSSDIYVWEYDPLRPRTLLLGGVVLLGVIAATLFPLWPNSVRVMIYYLSVLGGVFVGSVFGIAILRSITFAFIWVVTLGRHHFWFLPNLLADVGFFDSFKPVYTYEYFGPEGEKREKSKDKSSDKEDNEDDENDDEVEKGNEKEAESGSCPGSKEGTDDDTAASQNEKSSDQNSDDSDQDGSVTNPDDGASDEYEVLEESSVVLEPGS